MKKESINYQFQMVFVNFDYIDDHSYKSEIETGFFPKKKNFNLIRLNTIKDNGWVLDCTFMWKLMTKKPTQL